MKKLVGLVLILAVLVLGGYYGMGALTEKTITKNITVINQSNSGLTAELKEYKRGWFNSEANIQWHLHLMARSVRDANGQVQNIPAQDYEMTMPITIYHGPIILANGIHFGMGYAQSAVPFPTQYLQQFDALFKTESIKPELKFTIFVNYLNTSTLDLSVPAFKLLAKDGTGQFDWQGMDTRVRISHGMNNISGYFSLSGLEFAKGDSDIILGRIVSEYDLHRTDVGLFLGTANLAVPSFQVAVKSKKIFELNNFDLRSDSDIENNLFNTRMTLSVKSMAANDQQYGPGSVDIALKNLDALVLAKMNEQITAMQNASEAEKQQAMLAMLPQLPKLFSKGAEFEVTTLTMKLPEGMVEGNMLVTLPKGDSGNPFELIQKIQGKAKLQMPKVVVKQVMYQSLLQKLNNQPELQQALSQQLQQGQATATSAQPAASNTPEPTAAQPAATNTPAAATAPTPAATSTTPAATTIMPTPEVLAAQQTEKQIAALEQTGLVAVQGSDYVVEVSLDQGKFTVNNKPFNPAMLKF